MLEKKEIVRLAGAIFFGVMTGVVIITFRNWSKPAPILIEMPQPTPPPEPTKTATPDLPNVHVTGEVNFPGVYTLPLDSIIQDAIEAAGGFTESADSDSLNLALPVSDGMQVRVPAAGADEQQVVISTPDAVESEDTSSEDTAPITHVTVNINEASASVLEGLPGIGPVLAEAIVAHREEHGEFPTIESIVDVSGIGPAKLDEIRAFIVVE
jgi:competence protein ComEA